MRILFPLAIIIALTIISLDSVNGGPDDEIKKKQTQLQKLRKEIDQYESKIKEREKKEKATLELLDTYDKQAMLLRKLVRKLHERETALESEIGETRKTITRLSGQLSYLKKHYARYVTAAYKNGVAQDVELLLTSKSLNQMLVRTEYLKRFSDQRKRDLERITTERAELETERALLQSQLDEQQEILAEKAKEQDKLKQQSQKRKKLLTTIRRDKSNFQRELKRKMQAAKEMEQLISKLIEEDRAKRDRKAKETGKTEREPVGAGPFAARKGMMRWPVAEGKVVARFGSQQHPVLKTVTQNTGIDISVAAGTSVTAVADGEISTISWLPSFGNLVIVHHGNGFRTVYAHLSEIVTSEGSKISEGDLIGRSGESLSGALFHFEVWKEREKQDPEAWLRPRSVSRR